MSHEIVNEQIAYVNQVPWHGLGTQLDEKASPEKFLKAAKLDWEVNPYPVMVQVGDELIEDPRKRAFVRSSDNKIMTYASPSWKPFQNRDAIDFMKRYVNAGGATMETVGALRDGKIVWGLAKLQNSFEVRPGDRVDGYLLITSPHVAGQSIKVSTTSVRVVCANTMALSERTEEVHYRQSHIYEFDVEEAQNRVAEAVESLVEAEKRAKIIDGLKITVEDAVKKVFVPTFTPEIADDKKAMKEIMKPESMPKVISAILDSMQNGPGAIMDTGWGALNGVTHYIDHVHGRSDEARFSSGTMGWGAKKKQEAEKRLMELAA